MSHLSAGGRTGSNGYLRIIRTFLWDKWGSSPIGRIVPSGKHFMNRKFELMSLLSEKDRESIIKFIPPALPEVR
jgi:hypothetical protein